MVTYLNVLIILLLSDVALAKEFPAQARLFAGSGSVKPEDVNLEYEAQGLKKVDLLYQYGVEITTPLGRFLNAGMRYTRRNVLRDELVSTSLTSYQADITQDSVALVARIPFIKSNFVRVDAFAGVGGTNTTLKMTSAAQDGELTRKDADGWFGAPYTSYGGSVAIGYKQFYLVVEGGIETNKITDLKRTGNMNTNIQTIDLSGSYFTVGLLFDGISATRK